MIIYTEDERKEQADENPLKKSLKKTTELYEKMLEECQNEHEKTILQNTIETLKKQITEIDKTNNNTSGQKIPSQGGNQGKIKKEEIRRKSLFDIYNFYCKVQLMIGKSSTFERIEYEMNSLNLNKLSMICIDFELYRKPDMVNQVLFFV